jgi:hypothetical protein
MPFLALSASEPKGWLFIGLAVVFGLILGALVVYAVREGLLGSEEAATAGSAAEPDEAEDEEDDEPAPLTDPTALRVRIDEDGVNPNTYLARFLEEQDGEEVGETVGITDDALVVKDGDDFLALPLEDVIEEEERLVAGDDVDWDAAAEAGEEWASGEEDRVEYDDEGMPVLDDD